MTMLFDPDQNYVIEWYDVCGPTVEWESPDDVRVYHAKCFSSGWVISNDGEVIALAGTKCEATNSVSNVMSIPLCCIVSTIPPAKDSVKEPSLDFNNVPETEVTRTANGCNVRPGDVAFVQKGTDRFGKPRYEKVKIGKCYEKKVLYEKPDSEGYIGAKATSLYWFNWALR